jgi:hypothetical protein
MIELLLLNPRIGTYASGVNICAMNTLVVYNNEPIIVVMQKSYLTPQDMIDHLSCISQT